jgi:gliding motility-associated-like protein
MWQGGSVWEKTKIDLNNPFDFKFNVFLGYDDAGGADGIVFMLQQESANLGAAGGGMGFDGVDPSIGIALDTWQNTTDNDPAYDHISIQENGVIKHGNDLAGPVQASSGSDNIEDGVWHVLQIKWDPATKTLSTYFDGVFRLSTKTDLIADIFKNDPLVYWGFSAATGGSYNIQKFCTALNPVFNSGLANDQICNGTPVIFKDSSTSFTTIKNYYWDFGDGTTSDLANPPPHLYEKPGIYQVKHFITAMDNCESEPFTRTIKIGDNPIISFQIFDTCETLNPRIHIDTRVEVGNINQWKWQINGSDFSNAENPDFSSFTAGNYSLKLTTTSNIGCISNSFENNFTINPKPAISMEANDGCKNIPVIFIAQQTDDLTSIKSWHWDFGDNNFSDQKIAQNIFTDKGNYNVLLQAEATNGCITSVSKNLFINAAKANAGTDTLIASNTFFQLNGSGGSSYSWFPTIGLSDPNVSNPIGKISDDAKYLLTVKTVEGCVDTASVKVRIFKGSAVYVPTAFSPNNDGLNDVLKPYYVSIKSLSFFTIYNRWGQIVFTTNDLNKGWDGFSKNKRQVVGSYVWVLKAVDAIGKTHNLKGSFVLLK